MASTITKWPMFLQAPSLNLTKASFCISNCQWLSTCPSPPSKSNLKSDSPLWHFWNHHPFQTAPSLHGPFILTCHLDLLHPINCQVRHQAESCTQNRSLTFTCWSNEHILYPRPHAQLVTWVMTVVQIMALGGWQVVLILVAQELWTHSALAHER